MQVTPSNLKWQPPVAYIKSQCKRYLLIGTSCKKWRYKYTTPAHMHHDSEKSQAIHSSVTALGLLKKKERWTNCMGGNIQNANFKHDSGVVKGCNQRGHPCTAHVDGLNRVKLQHNEGIRWTTFQCLLDAILELARHDSCFWQAYRPTCTRIPLIHSSRYVSHCETSIRCR